MVGQALEQCCRHFGVTEHARPFRQAEVGRDDDAGPLAEPAQQMEQQRAARCAERQISVLIEDDETVINEPVGDPGLSRAGPAEQDDVVGVVDELSLPCLRRERTEGQVRQQGAGPVPLTGWTGQSRRASPTAFRPLTGWARLLEGVLKRQDARRG